jgi:hypothetical protein
LVSRLIIESRAPSLCRVQATLQTCSLCPLHPPCTWRYNASQYNSLSHVALLHIRYIAFMTARFTVSR